MASSLALCVAGYGCGRGVGLVARDCVIIYFMKKLRELLYYLIAVSVVSYLWHWLF